MIDTVFKKVKGDRGSQTSDVAVPTSVGDELQSTESDATDTTDADESVSTDGQSPTGAPVIGFDEIFGILKNQRRRDVLRRLQGDAEEIQLGELSEQIAARECDKDVSQINSSERKRVYVGLYQCHLPKMADVGAIEYNKPRGIIERGPNFAQFRNYLPDSEAPTELDTVSGRKFPSIAGLIG